MSGKMGKILKFVREDVWDVEITSLNRLRAMGVKAVRVVCLVVKGFREDECPLYASSLTYMTLMAIVPLLAFSFAVARGLGGAQLAKERIRGGVAEWTQRFGQDIRVAGLTVAAPKAEAEEAAAPAEGGTLEPEQLAAQINHLVDLAFEKVENVSFAGLGAVGLVLMLWTVIAVLGSVEAAFNRVWGVVVQRPLWRKVMDYTSVLFILPLLGLAASSVQVADFATRFLEDPLRARVAGVLDSGALRNLTGLGMTTLCFAFLIMFMPNTKVRARAGLAGGLVAALLFVGWLLACAALQVGAAKTGKIYGSFAIVPILLAWLYVSWQIVLFGAEVAFAVQNCGTYRMESGARSASAQSRILLALSILKEAAQAMAARERGVQAAAYAAARRVPVRFLNGVIEELIEAGLLGELADAKGRFVLLRAPGELRVREVIDAVMASGADPADLGMEPADPSIAAALRSAGSGMDASLKTTTLQNLLG